MTSFNHMQQEAKEIFAANGWPNKRNEDWHYTDLSARLPSSFQNQSLELSEDIRLDKLTCDIKDSLQLDFINGLLTELEELPDGLEISALIDHPELVQQSDEDVTDPLLYANLAHLETGIVIDVSQVIEEPMEIHFHNTSSEEASFVRIVFRLAEGASLTLLESHSGWGHTQLVSDVYQHEDSMLRHLRLHQAEDTQVSLLLNRVSLDARAQYHNVAISLSGGLGRLETRVTFNAPGSHAGLATALLSGGKQHIDISTRLNHLSADTTSDTVARTILDDEACGIFQGKVIVHQDAQRVEATQKSDALMLSADAMMNVKPELEIYADDVACAHGSAIGEIDHEALFFLRSRGIGEEAARIMLVEGFVSEILGRLDDFAAGAVLQENLLKRVATFLKKSA
jgi:Fe-S cluster assembly protein SufD